MITILFFASIRDSMGIEKHMMEFSPALKTVSDVINQCKNELPALATVLSNQPKLMYALNQEIVHSSAEVNDDDEIALLPPVTGG